MELFIFPPPFNPLFQSNPRSVVDHREIVLKCLTDDDITIRTRALELLAGIVSRKSLVDLVHHLLQVSKIEKNLNGKKKWVDTKLR